MSTDRTKTVLNGFDSLPDVAMVRVPTVAALNGISIVTAWRWAKAGRLPAPVKRGGVTAWRVGDLRKALSQPAG
jgi:predicted DNA-binding transcriptional regulator AlpA